METQDFESFLYWVKETTERRWADFSVSKKDGNWWNHKHDLFEGAKWVDPLADEEIDALESKWGIKFSKNHRNFLKILHKVDKELVIEYEDDETGEVAFNSVPFFHDWRNDDAMKKKFDWPFDCIYSDVFESCNPSWLKSWGIKPDSKADCLKIIEAWREKAPVLIPINSYCYIVSSIDKDENHVLSSRGLDMLLYNINIKEHLLYELKWDLGLDVREYEETDEVNPPPSIVSMAIQSLQNEEELGEDTEYKLQLEGERERWLEERRKMYHPIPYWEEVILYYNSGWSSIGLKCPYGKF